MSFGKLAEMRTFERVAAHESFAGAARELGISPSAVSKQIRLLEERLGVKLLHRTTRRVTLTQAGRLYFERAQKILGEVDELEVTVRGLHSEPRGHAARLGAAGLRAPLPVRGGRGVRGGVPAPAHRVRDDGSEGGRGGGGLRRRRARREAGELDARDAAPRPLRARALRVAGLSRGVRRARTRPPRSARTTASSTTTRSPTRGRSASDGRAQTVAATGRLRANSAWTLRALVLAGQGIALHPEVPGARGPRGGAPGERARGRARRRPRGDGVASARPARRGEGARVRGLHRRAAALRALVGAAPQSDSHAAIG